MIAPAPPRAADVFFQQFRTQKPLSAIVSIPTTGSFTSSFSVTVPQGNLGKNSVLGAMFVSGIPRTQGLFADQYRTVLLTLAKSFGEVDLTGAASTEPVGALLDRLRTRSGLPAAEIARMAGIQRRQLYNLVDGGNTTPDRERRIRAIAKVVDDLLARLGDPSTVRSSLLAPLDLDLRSFVDFATQGESIADAERLLAAYLDSRGNTVRSYIQTPRRAREQEGSAAQAIKDTSDVAPDRG